MQRLRGFPRRFRLPWRSDARIRRDVEDELAFHLAAKIEALQRDGLSAEHAREEARRQFGDVDGARERLVAGDRRGETRLRRLAMLDDLVRDIRLASRSLRRTPGFTLVAVLALGLGIGVVSGAFSLVNVLELKPALMDEPDEVLGVFARHPARSNDRFRFFSYAEYVELRDRVETFSSLAAQWLIDAGVEEGDVTRRRTAAFASSNYFETLGVPPARGRGFTLAEERGESEGVAVVSHDFWVRNGADPNVLGSEVRVHGEPFVVVGVAARGFTGTMALLGVDVWLPLASMQRSGAPGIGGAPSLRDPRYRSLMLFGRLEDGVSAARAEAELAALAPGIEANVPGVDGAPYTYIVGSMGRTSRGAAPTGPADISIAGLLAFGMSAVVLAVACLNLANMFLARGTSRRTELAIRQSLGSGRARLMRQLLTEGLLLAALGGAVGLIWSYWAAGSIAVAAAGAVPVDTTMVVDARPDLGVLLVTGAASALAVLLFGLGPAWRVTGTDVASGLKEGAGAAAFGRRRTHRLFSGTSFLLVVQIALSLALLTAGGLFVRSAFVAANATPGFPLDSTLLLKLDPSLVGYDEARSQAAYAQVLERLRARPELDSAGLASRVPFSGDFGGITSVSPAGVQRGADSNGQYTVVSSEYFDALRVPILRGRDFTDAETASDAGPRVAIVDEPLARRLFPDADALGRRIRLAAPGARSVPTVMEIVGIAAGTPGSGFDPAQRPHVYVPFGQAHMPGMHLLVGVREEVAEPAALLETIRSEIREIDASLPVLSMTTMRAFRDANWELWASRTGARLAMLLGTASLFLAMVGLYGVRAFLMSRRTREIGVRMALGATRGTVLRQLMRESLGLTATGLVVGLVLALAAGRILSSLLYEISATDPWTYLGAAAFLALAATVASWLPAERALRVEPSAALRHE